MFRSIKLCGIAVASVVGILGFIFVSISASEAYKNWRNEGFQDKFSYLKAREDEYYQRAIKPIVGESIGWDELRTTLKSPKVVAITIASASSPYVLQRKGGELDPIMESMETDLVPKSVEDTNLIIGLSYRYDVVGKFSDGKSAFQEVCHFFVSDAKTGQKLLEGHAAGSMPPTRKKEYAGDQYGGQADKQVMELVRKGLSDLLNEQVDS